MTEWTPKSVVVSDKLEPLALVISLIQGRANHFIQINKNLIDEDLFIAANLVGGPQKYFEHGASTLVKNIKATFATEFCSPDDKDRVRMELGQFVAQVSGASVIEAAEAIFEEMYMNAIYDAPREAQRLKMLDKSYACGDKAFFKAVVGDNRLVLSCSDPFGSLDIAKCLSRMEEVYKKGVGDSIHFRDGVGAGIGIVLMFEQAAGLYLGVIPGQCTTVCAVIPIGMSNRQRANVKKKSASNFSLMRE